MWNYMCCAVFWLQPVEQLPEKAKSGCFMFQFLYKSIKQEIEPRRYFPVSSLCTMLSYGNRLITVAF